MLIDLANESRKRDGKHIRLRRSSSTWRMFETRACRNHLRLMFNGFEKRVDLLVGGCAHQGSLALAQFFCKFFETNIFIDGLDCWAHHLCVQLPYQALKFRMNFTFTMVHAHGDTCHLPMRFHARIEPRKGCSSHAMRLGGLANAFAAEDISRCRKIAEKTSAHLWL